jgi:hypothetical protein
VDANFLADQVSRHVISLDDAREMIGALTYEAGQEDVQTLVTVLGARCVVLSAVLGAKC